VQETVGLTDSVLDLAASIRARFGFRTPDAIHLAAAMAAHCDQFLTNDRSLRAFSEVTVVVVDDLVAEANADTDEITGDT
jgi:predicted nucleic acid-binding protein